MCICEYVCGQGYSSGETERRAMRSQKLPTVGGEEKVGCFVVELTVPLEIVINHLANGRRALCGGLCVCARKAALGASGTRGCRQGVGSRLSVHCRAILQPWMRGSIQTAAVKGGGQTSWYGVQRGTVTGSGCGKRGPEASCAGDHVCLPACLPACLHACLSACLSACLPGYPPGKRHSSAASPLLARPSTKRLHCVLLPQRSQPSRTTRSPRRVAAMVSVGGAYCCTRAVPQSCCSPQLSLRHCNCCY